MTEAGARGRARIVLLAPLALLLGGCVSTPPITAPIAQAETPRFDPFAFFVGESRGTGTLAKVLSDPVPITVVSRGRIVTEAETASAWAIPPRRVLVLDQTVTEGDKPRRARQWRLVELAPGRYEGTLTDAIGPVTGRSEGNRLLLEYMMEGSFKVRQELTLAPDGTRADNVLKVSQLGITVAVLVEDIRKTP